MFRKTPVFVPAGALMKIEGLPDMSIFYPLVIDFDKVLTSGVGDDRKRGLPMGQSRRASIDLQSKRSRRFEVTLGIRT